MPTKIRIKLPPQKVAKTRSAEQVMFDRFKTISDLSEEEKQLLKGYVAVNKFRESRRSAVREQMNELNLNSPRSGPISSGFRPVKGYNAKFSSYKKPRLESRKLFVKNFVSRKALENSFQSFGVENISLQEGKSYAFVTLRNELDVASAIRNLNGSTLGALPAKTLCVERARQKPFKKS